MRILNNLVNAIVTQTHLLAMHIRNQTGNNNCFICVAQVPTRFI